MKNLITIVAMALILALSCKISKAEVIVKSQGRRVVLSVSDVAYVRGVTANIGIRAALVTGAVNCDVADNILAILKRRK